MDSRASAHIEADVTTADLTAALDQHDAERAVAREARVHELSVARLEHMERHQRMREQHRTERKHR